MQVLQPGAPIHAEPWLPRGAAWACLAAAGEAAPCPGHAATSKQRQWIGQLHYAGEIVVSLKCAHGPGLSSMPAAPGVREGPGIPVSGACQDVDDLAGALHGHGLLLLVTLGAVLAQAITHAGRGQRGTWTILVIYS